MKKILVAEDDKFLANAYRVKLTKTGFDTRVAADGEEALKILQNFDADLMILDLMMPVKDGFATLEAVRKDARFKTTPIIVASNLGQKEDIDKGMRLGATDFIIKSNLSLDSLITKIHGLVKE